VESGAVQGAGVDDADGADAQVGPQMAMAVAEVGELLPSDKLFEQVAVVAVRGGGLATFSQRHKDDFAGKGHAHVLSPLGEVVQVAVGVPGHQVRRNSAPAKGFKARQAAYVPAVDNRPSAPFGEDFDCRLEPAGLAVRV
jgi:hypothetical protein